VVIDPIRLPDGRLTGYAKVTRDLTEQKRAEGDVRRSEEQFRRLVQGVTDYAIFTLSPAGIVTNWNIGAQRIKGYAPEEIIGKHFSQFYTEEDRARGEPQVALQTAEREGRFEREAWRVRKDGTRFLSHVVIDAIRDEDGKLIGFAKITRDVTERKTTQEALERAREALFQSQKMDAVGQLTGGIAHDFNNLLMAILSSLQMLEKRLPDDPQMKRLLDNAIAGAQRGTSLTQRMLAFARRQQLDTKPIEVRDLVKGMTEFLERSIGSTVTIDTHFPLALPEVIADQNQIELALLNLCVNARDAMPNGGAITIAARAHAVESGHETALSPGRYVCLSVSDSGEGMDAETLARATEPFFTTKGVGKGTGLGLPMVHGMSEQMGGRLLLKSTPGQGTRAEIWLRAAEAKAPSPEPPIPEPEAPKRNLRVLAVDDDALVLFNTVAMLEELGHTAIEAHSGTHALEILETEKVDILITDQSMPKMTGVQLIEAVKAKWPELPVILATGYAELPGGVEISAPKLNKPFSERALAAALVAAGV
jgi:PAS domain S-box-containing protein